MNRVLSLMVVEVVEVVPSYLATNTSQRTLQLLLWVSTELMVLAVLMKQPRKVAKQVVLKEEEDQKHSLREDIEMDEQYSSYHHYTMFRDTLWQVFLLVPHEQGPEPLHLVEVAFPYPCRCFSCTKSWNYSRHSFAELPMHVQSHQLLQHCEPILLPSLQYVLLVPFVDIV